MTAKDFMTTAVVTVTPETSLREVIRLLVELELSGLIVLDPITNNVAGVISEKDVMVGYDFLKNIDASIKDFYNKEVISIQEDTPMEEINRLLFESNIRRVPVIKDHKLLGVVSRRDILKQILQESKVVE